MQTIPLAAPSVETLRAHRARQNADRLAAGARWVTTDLIFTTRQDSALSSDAAAATDLGVAGVTTNPKLMAAAAGPPIATLAELCDCGPGVVFYQVTADSVAAREEAHDAHAVCPAENCPIYGRLAQGWSGRSRHRDEFVVAGLGRFRRTTDWC